MISAFLSIAAGILLLVGAGFALAGAIGLLRFPDLYTRMHAASKAGTLGSGFCLLAVAIDDNGFDVTTRAIAAIFFFLLTAPISAHLLARASLLTGYQPLATRPVQAETNLFVSVMSGEAPASTVDGRE